MSESDPKTKVRWWNKVYRGRAFEHRMQAGVAVSLGLVMVVLPLSIMRIKEMKNRDAPRIDDQRASLIRQKIWTSRRRIRENAATADDVMAIPISTPPATKPKA